MTACSPSHCAASLSSSVTPLRMPPRSQSLAREAGKRRLLCSAPRARPTELVHRAGCTSSELVHACLRMLTSLLELNLDIQVCFFPELRRHNPGMLLAGVPPSRPGMLSLRPTLTSRVRTRRSVGGRARRGLVAAGLPSETDLLPFPVPCCSSLPST